MKYEVADPFEFGTGISGRARSGEVRREAAHQLGVVKDPSYLVACYWAL